MFAATTPSRTSLITPLLDPNADAALRSLFFGKDHPIKKVTRKHVMKWSEKAAIPKPVVIAGLGTVVSRRGEPGPAGDKPLVREIHTTIQRTTRSNKSSTGVVRQTLTQTAVYGGRTNARPKSAAVLRSAATLKRQTSYLGETNPREYCTIPLKALTIDDHGVNLDRFDNTLPMQPLTTSITETRKEEADYANSVDRIAIPPGFVLLKGTENMSKKQVFDTYEAAGYTGMQYRLLFQPTITSRDKHGNIVQTLGPYYVGCVDYEEKKSRKIRPIPRPKSAPVNIRKDQRVSRERLSVPSQFQKLGNQFLDKKQEEMESMFPGKRVYKAIKTLPGETHVTDGYIVDDDFLSKNLDDPTVWEWVVQKDARRKSGYNPNGVLMLKKSGLFKPEMLLPDPDELNYNDRIEYMEEKMGFIGTPKPTWGEKFVTVFGRNSEGKMLTTKITRVNKELEEVRKEMKSRLAAKGAVFESKFAVKNDLAARRRKRATTGNSILKFSITR